MGNTDEQRGNALKRMYRTAVVAVVWTPALAIGLGSGLPVVAAEVTNDKRAGVPTGALMVQDDIGWESLRHGNAATAANQAAEAARLERSSGKSGTFEKKPAARDMTNVQMAQFQLPQPTPGGEAPPTQLPQALKYQYSIGTESDTTYRQARNLNRHVRDDSLILAPQINGYVTYRPTGWLEATLELTLEREIPAIEPDRIILPDGEIQVAEKRRFSLLAEQAFVRFKDLTGPVEFTVGRRNFEDDRRWLYDTALDGVLARLKLGSFHAEASVSRERSVNLDLLKQETRTRIDNYMLFMDYRGIEDHKLAGYAIMRHDNSQVIKDNEGRPLLMGVRSSGRPADQFNYWTELAFLRGRDEFSRKLSGWGLDVGGTYRFTNLPLHPNVTLAFAFATGDENPQANTNTEFRQTGLQSNEQRFGGVTQFKRYGETLDPELSNLRILSVGLGFRPAANFHVDIVYHHYWLNEIAEKIRNPELTALMNTVDTQLSKDVGNEVDVIIGFRRLFGLQRLGLDLRTGWFFPGKAFLRNVGDDVNPIIRRADNAMSVLIKVLY